MNSVRSKFDAFYLFAELALLELTGARLHPNDRYVEYLCHELFQFIEGRVSQMLVNLPARHLKTTLVSVIVPAFMLGLNPKLKFLIVAYDEDIAEDIVRLIKNLMSSRLYRRLFKTRIDARHSRKNDFSVLGGGRVRAAPVGSVTGKGGDVIIFDDPHNVAYWDSAKRNRRVVKSFETLRTRRDGGQKSRFLVVGHRVAADDLSAHILERRDFHHVALPLFAPHDMSFRMGDRTWVLPKGQALRPDAYPPEEIERLRDETFGGPSFWLHYQQGIGPDDDIDIDVRHFPFFRGQHRGKPVVISVDTTFKTDSSSRNAIHVYAVGDGIYVLVDAFAEACTFRTLLRQVKHFAHSYRASLILVEETGRGGDLIEELRSQTTVAVEAVKQPRASKLSRFREILPLIRAKKVQIVRGSDSVERVVDELITFPNSEFDDNVDVLVNFLNRMLSQKPLPEARSQNRASIGVALGSDPRGPSAQPVRGIALLLSSRRYDPFK